MTLNLKGKLLWFSRGDRWIVYVSLLVIIFSAFKGWQIYRYVFTENVQKEYVLYITRKTTFTMVTDSLEANKVMRNMKAFNWVANKKKYSETIKAGRYILKKGMNTSEVVNKLRSGLQDPVRLTFNNIRTREQLAGVVSHYLEADSLSLIGLFNPDTIREFGFTPETFPAMFIPNTYEFYWTTSAKQFAERMKQEYNKFWNEERLDKAQNMGMTPEQVATLAAIVQEETNQAEEKPRVAGVYINRLHKGMLLQADPTVKFAVGDMTLRRILDKHLEVNSPYNTYRHPGLPPGPITFPEISSLDAVLNYEKNDYLYFCAKEDFSGFHNFARNSAEHARNAARYHAALNVQKIKD